MSITLNPDRTSITIEKYENPKQEINDSSPKQQETFVLNEDKLGDCLERIGALYASIMGLLNSLNQAYYNNTSRFFRNCMRVLIAGGLPFVGGVIAGDPRIVAVIGIGAIYLGAVFGGAANALSTVDFLETDTEDRVAETENRVEEAERKINLLEKQVVNLTQLAEELKELIQKMEGKKA